MHPSDQLIVIPGNPKYIYCLSAINVFRWFSFDVIMYLKTIPIENINFEYRKAIHLTFDFQLDSNTYPVAFLVVIGIFTPFE